MDFTLNTYRQLLVALQKQGFYFQAFEDYMRNPAEKAVILRHDVDRLPKNALRTAQIEHSMGIRGTYFFRTVKASWNECIMRQIVDLGHELAYHYEDLAIARGDLEKAMQHFEKQLQRLRLMYPTRTICMHGSPLSKFDNRDLWKHYNYRDYGIIGEPYFDLDFEKVLYLTDTGRRWDGAKVNVRDKSMAKEMDLVVQPEPGMSKPPGIKTSKAEPGLRFRYTKDIIRAAENDQLPPQMMITIHPQRWTDKPFPWVKELVWQNLKNLVKRMLVAKTK